MSGNLYLKITEILGASTAKERTATVLCLAVNPSSSKARIAQLQFFVWL